MLGSLLLASVISGQELPQYQRESLQTLILAAESKLRSKDSLSESELRSVERAIRDLTSQKVTPKAPAPAAAAGPITGPFATYNPFVVGPMISPPDIRTHVESTKKGIKIYSYKVSDVGEITPVDVKEHTRREVIFIHSGSPAPAPR